MKEARRRKTRNQRKREFRQAACMVFALLMLWGMFLAVVVHAWSDHPAEQPIDGRAYLESIQHIGGDSHA